jgi:hypothetical protein
MDIKEKGEYAIKIRWKLLMKKMINCFLEKKLY